MFQPIIKSTSNKRLASNTFSGLNRGEAIRDMEFVNMVNMSSEKMPYLTPRMGREPQFSRQNIQGILPTPNSTNATMSSFTGVANNIFYFNDLQIGNVSSGKKFLIDYNGYIIILPDKKYYCYTAQEANALKDIEFGYTDTSMKFSYTVDSNNSDLFQNKINKTGGWGEFKIGDSLTIICAESKNSTISVVDKYQTTNDEQILSCVVNKITGNDMLVTCYNRVNKPLKFTYGTYISTVKRSMPNITKACVFNNRLFGIDDVGEMIYASKLADFKNWNTFEGLSTDSWFAQVGTEGKFTAIVTYRQNIVAFKKNYIHQIYGQTPTNFNLAKQLTKGCIDGDSVAEVNGALFFLSHDGVYIYNGGNPSLISQNLNCAYENGVGGGDGNKYYLSTQNELVVFDTRYNVWHKEDNPKIFAFTNYNNGLYAVFGTSGDMNVCLLNKGVDNTVKWSVESKEFTDNTLIKRGVNNLYFRSRLSFGSSFKVSVSCDDGEWVEFGEVVYGDMAVKRVPVMFRATDRYKYKIEGTGNIVIECIERVVYADGINENV